MKGLTEEEAMWLDRAVKAVPCRESAHVGWAYGGFESLVKRGLVGSSPCLARADSVHASITPLGLAMLALWRSGQMRAT